MRVRKYGVGTHVRTLGVVLESEVEWIAVQNRSSSKVGARRRIGGSNTFRFELLDTLCLPSVALPVLQRVNYVD